MTEGAATEGGVTEGGVTGEDPWSAVQSWLSGRPVAEAAARAQLLGLPAAVIATSPAPVTRPAVAVRLGGPARGRGARPVVIDLSALWAGPLCAHLLGPAGARIIKVESRDRPDGARRGAGGFYDLLNAGHESVALDFGTPAGRRALAGLIARADVVLEGSRPRALRQLGLDAAEAIAAGTVWVAISAYGRDQAGRVGFGDDVAAAAGLVVDDGDGPYPVGDAIADPLAGATAAAAATVALRAGRGCLLDVSMRDVAARAAACGRARRPWSGATTPGGSAARTAWYRSARPARARRPGGRRRWGRTPPTCSPSEAAAPSISRSSRGRVPGSVQPRPRSRPVPQPHAQPRAPRPRPRSCRPPPPAAPPARHGAGVARRATGVRHRAWRAPRGPARSGRGVRHRCVRKNLRLYTERAEVTVRPDTERGSWLAWSRSRAS